MADGDTDDVVTILRRSGLLAPGEPPRLVPLAGGVSSDIWRVDLAGGTVCVKRARARLKVAADWRVPVSRNAFEVRWYETAAAFALDAVPKVLASDAEAGVLVMTYFEPTTFRLWKDELRRGRVDIDAAAAVGRRLVAVHAGTAGDAAVAARFATDDLFHALRLEPYLEATAQVHADLAGPLRALAAATAGTRRALVHGDVSPKNILLGPRGPVFLDAECAWYGDPAFDLAFCLNHLLLKGRWVPTAAPALLTAFRALAAAYLAGVSWEPAAAVEARAAALLPGLLLARVDGKSPVEYLDDFDKAAVRAVARRLLADYPIRTLVSVVDAWERSLSA